MGAKARLQWIEEKMEMLELKFYIWSRIEKSRDELGGDNVIDVIHMYLLYNHMHPTFRESVFYLISI